MYYEEKLIDGVLHFRGDPRGEWIAKSPAELTALLIDTRRQLADALDQLAEGG